MAAKGQPKSGGRTTGTPNKSTQASLATLQKAASAGLTPLDYMLKVLRDDASSAADRKWAADAAAPYLHPKLQSIAHTGGDGGPIRLSVVNYSTQPKPDGKPDDPA